MDNDDAVQLLAGLAQAARLNIFRLLVQVGEAGLPAGMISERLAIPNSTLSFHLKALQHAGLIQSKQVSRFIYYAANFSVMQALLGYLTANCCAGAPCGLPSIAIKKDETPIHAMPDDAACGCENDRPDTAVCGSPEMHHAALNQHLNPFDT